MDNECMWLRHMGGRSGVVSPQLLAGLASDLR